MQVTDEMVETAARAAFDTWWEGRGPGREPSWLQTKDRWLKEARAALTASLSQGQDGAVGVKSSTPELHGPYGWLNGHRALSEDSWALESDPLENSDEYFAIPLYALVNPFKEIGKDFASPAQEAGAEPVAIELHIVFKDEGGPFDLRFIEVETPDGKSIRAGTWMKREDGYDVLALSVHSSDVRR